MSQRRQYETWAEATADMFHYIEIFYNRRRRHSTMGYRSPEQIEIERPRNRLGGITR